MESIHRRGVGQEHPRSHLIQLLAAFIFFFIWGLDTFIFKISTVLARYIPFFVQIIIFIILLTIGLLLIFKSGHMLFHEDNPSKLITTGIFSHTRHPIYFGVLLIYLGFIFLSMSLISIIGLIIVFILYNWIVNFEENDLEEIFKEEYLEYKKKVPKWIPSLS